MRSPALPLLLRNNRLRDPRRVPGLAAWYDASDLSSMVYDGSNRVQLVADKSGNSGVNALCLNGAVGNYGSAPDSVPLSITGTIDIRCEVRLPSYATGGIQSLVSKYNTTANQRSYSLTVTATGFLALAVSSDGTAGVGMVETITSDATLASAGVTAFSRTWLRATWVTATRKTNFYVSTDNTNWTQVGTEITGASVNTIFDGTAMLEIGSITSGTLNLASGLIYRAQIYSGIAGTLAFDANFTAQSKLATSFPESSSNAATVTINTSGDFGARISGERDLVQMTAANMPVLTIASTGNYLTFDGTNDCMKAAAFALSQPETVYFMGSQVTWTDTEAIYDGGSNNTGKLQQRTTTPGIRIVAGSALSLSSDLTLNSRAIVSAAFNSTASSQRVNRLSATTGDAGASSMNGFTLGGAGDGSGQSNITASEIAIYAVAHDTPTQDRVALYLGRKWRISL